MIIRQANMKDSKPIVQIAAGLGYQDQTVQSSSSQRLERLLDSNDDKVWVAELDGDVIGWLHAQHTFRVASADFIEILGLSVSEKIRLQGAGRALVEQAKVWALDENVSLRVRTNNIRDDAKKFYSALGFSLVKMQSVFQISL